MFGRDYRDGAPVINIATSTTSEGLRKRIEEIGGIACRHLERLTERFDGCDVKSTTRR